MVAEHERQALDFVTYDREGEDIARAGGERPPISPDQPR
jgi:hypothetical protein